MQPIVLWRGMGATMSMNMSPPGSTALRTTACTSAGACICRLCRACNACTYVHFAVCQLTSPGPIDGYVAPASAPRRAVGETRSGFVACIG
ncbi:hypothetical protein RJ55_01981 [Drechmeria coniospora]|nr:hypothetical protein RJ55_01981 [Drechmeria coniospora]